MATADTASNAGSTGKVRVSVVTPERAVLDETADFVVLPMVDGELGVLPKRAPLIGRLGPGELRITEGERNDSYFVEGGFAQVRDDTLIVLTANARPSSDITAEAAKQALHDAEGIEATTPAQQASRRRSIDVANAMVRLAETRRSNPGQGGQTT